MYENDMYPKKIEPDYFKVWVTCAAWLESKNLLEQFNCYAKELGIQTKDIFIIPTGSGVEEKDLK